MAKTKQPETVYEVDVTEDVAAETSQNPDPVTEKAQEIPPLSIAVRGLS